MGWPDLIAEENENVLQGDKEKGAHLCWPKWITIFLIGKEAAAAAHKENTLIFKARAKIVFFFQLNCLKSDY